MIQREDLAAAAALGLLNQRQIDPLLIFLLQQDVDAKRKALRTPSRKTGTGGASALLTCAGGMLAFMMATWLAVLFTNPAVQATGIGALFFFTLFYGAGAFGFAAWCRQRGFGVPGRSLTTLLIALVPVAVYAMG